MLLFRSEEHLTKWLAKPERPSGERLALEQQWELAKKWFAGRDEPEWKKRTPQEAEGVFRGVGLNADFWKLT
jgi:hypothetical protein